MGRPPKPSRRYHITLEMADAAELDARAAELGQTPTTVAGHLLAQTLRVPVASGFDGHAQPAPQLPRWEWPTADLLADHRWWATWLPRLNELMGRPLTAYSDRTASALDARGYLDLLVFLFPPVRREGRVVATWSSGDYTAHAPDGLAAIWEPVVRHVAEALSALELTGTAGADPVLRIRVEDDLGGIWLGTLRRLVGDEVAGLPGQGP